MLRFFVLILALALLGGAAPLAAQEKTLVVGYFPNITHAQALIAQNMAADGLDWYKDYLPGVAVKWATYNAGPSAMEALMAKKVDMCYVGPGPALNAYMKTQAGVIVVAGSVRGGAGLVVQGDSKLSAPADFKDKRIATPELGNTQDIACRAWLRRAGLDVTVNGGDVTIIPIATSNMLFLFANKEIDGVWTVEPWISRLELESGGRLAYADPPESSLTTVVVVREDVFETFPELADDFIKGHRAMTEWINNNPEEARKRLAAELTRQTGKEMPLAVLEKAWPRLVFDASVGVAEFEFSLAASEDAGFVKVEDYDLSYLVQGR